jgi:formylglycine-generating enzyme required for sulfatase activity
VLLGGAGPLITGTRKIESLQPRTAVASRRWVAIAAIVAVLGGSFAGFEYARRSAEERAQHLAEAKRQADTAAAIKRAEEEAAAMRQQDERLAKEKRVAEERDRQEAEGKRRVDEAAAKKRAEEAARAKARSEAEPPKSAAPTVPAQPVPPPVVANPRSSSSRCNGIAALVGNEQRCLKPTDSFKDCDTCPEMVVLPAGNFMMGSNDGNSEEKPVHKVTIGRPFAVGKFEVTFAEWDTCVSEVGCSHIPNDRGWGRGRRPVINVSWEDVTKQYLPWLSRMSGRNYRLLSEAEWEYSARAGTLTRYAFGNTITKQQAQYSEGPDGSAGNTVEVGSFKPNGFGLYDMHGNVWEWVEDCWHETYVNAPSDGNAWMSSCSGDLRRVRRGGSYYNVAKILSSSFRAKNLPIERLNFGFRIARTL